MKYELLCGDCIDVLKTLEDESVQCVVTSPPYYGLRDYGVEGQLGLERSPEEYVAKLVDIFRVVRRVLRNDGTIWVNMGDSYATRLSGDGWSDYEWKTGGKVSPKEGTISTIKRTREDIGLKPKDLLGIPWRVAFALQADGWWLRSDIIWHKPNPMPESVRDRPTKSHEYVFLLAKSQKYYYDAEAVREPHITQEKRPDGIVRNRLYGYDSKENKIRGFKTKDNDIEQPQHHGNDIGYSVNGRNRRTVWTIPTAPYPEAHFATYPPALVEPCILAGTSERGCCPVCGKPWVRMVSKKPSTMNIRVRDAKKGILDKKSGFNSGASLVEIANYSEEELGNSVTIGWQPTCTHDAEPAPCVVLDPFCGSGTTGEVALRYGRDFIGIELNPEYIKLAEKRIQKVLLPMFMEAK